MQVKHDDLKEAAARFVEELGAGKEFIADHKPTQVEVLDQAIKAVNDELLSLLGSLHEGLYVDAASPPADVVNSLEQLQERLAQLKVFQTASNARFEEHMLGIESTLSLLDKHLHVMSKFSSCSSLLLRLGSTSRTVL